MWKHKKNYLYFVKTLGQRSSYRFAWPSNEQLPNDNLSVHCSISVCHNKTDVPTRDLRISGAKQVKTVLDKIYENASIYLDRKYKIYESIYLN